MRPAVLVIDVLAWHRAFVAVPDAVVQKVRFGAGPHVLVIVFFVRGVRWVIRAVKAASGGYFVAVNGHRRTALDGGDPSAIVAAVCTAIPCDSAP